MLSSLCFFALLLFALSSVAAAVTRPLDESQLTAQRQRWVAWANKDEPPFSFRYGDQDSRSFLGNWGCTRRNERLDDNRVAHRVTYTDPKTRLEVCFQAVEYRDFPVVEWVITLQNKGPADTPILANIHALDLAVRPPALETLVVRHFEGGHRKPEAFKPLSTHLALGETLVAQGTEGRSSDAFWPYFNFDAGSQGLILAVGWPGQWSAQFQRTDPNTLSLAAGQQITHFRLRPGEEVRTPLIVLLTWQGGDWIDGQNVWRRWMMAHSMPRPGGHLPPPLLLGSSYRAYNEMTKATEENQIMFIQRYLDEKIPLDYWWMDAGWYPGEPGDWGKVGTWEVDKERFPRGFKAISAFAHAHNVKILLWFEPERVSHDTWLWQNHRDWILGDQEGLLNLGEPAAWQWLVNHIDRFMTEQGINLYRQDLNMGPLPIWQKHDAADRQGLLENKHVTGLLAYYDELLRRHPNMLIDTCAGGGRRNDIEMMRRAVPLHRTDWGFEPIGTQCQTYGISFWLPYYGAGTVACSQSAYHGSEAEGPTPVEPYAFWSNCYPSVALSVDLRQKTIDYETLRQLIDQRRQMVDNFYGDYYPLTDYTLAKEAWIAWQFHRPEQGQGMVQAFRRDASDQPGQTFKLRGLAADSPYELAILGKDEIVTMTGRQLMQTGLPIIVAEQPGARVITYRQLR